MREVSPDKSRFLARLVGNSWIRNIGRTFLQMPYTDDELLISLSNSLKLHELSVRQSRSIPGRLMAFLGKPLVQPDEIEIDGTRTKQLFDLADSKPPIPIRINKNYVLDIAKARSLLKVAANNRRPA